MNFCPALAGRRSPKIQRATVQRGQTTRPVPTNLASEIIWRKYSPKDTPVILGEERKSLLFRKEDGRGSALTLGMVSGNLEEVEKDFESDVFLRKKLPAARDNARL